MSNLDRPSPLIGSNGKIILAKFSQVHSVGFIAGAPLAGLQKKKRLMGPEEHLERSFALSVISKNSRRGTSPDSANLREPVVTESATTNKSFKTHSKNCSNKNNSVAFRI